MAGAIDRRGWRRIGSTGTSATSSPFSTPPERSAWCSPGTRTARTWGTRSPPRHPERLAGVIGIGAVGGGDEPMSQRADDASQVRDGGMGELMQALREQEADIPDWFARQMTETDSEMFALELEG